MSETLKRKTIKIAYLHAVKIVVKGSHANAGLLEHLGSLHSSPLDGVHQVNCDVAVVTWWATVGAERLTARLTVETLSIVMDLAVKRRG